MINIKKHDVEIKNIAYYCSVCNMYYNIHNVPCDDFKYIVDTNNSTFICEILHTNNKHYDRKHKNL